MKKKGNLKEMNMDDLKKKLADLKDSMRSMRFKAEGAKSKNVKESLSLRKEVARVMTFINQRNQNAK